MKGKKFEILSLCLLMILSGCSQGDKHINSPNADWAYSFVVWNGYIYQITEEYVNDINQEIGEVTYHSNVESTYNGNFSNKYEQGTKYYSIKGIGIEEAIAIEEQNGKFRKAVIKGKYGEN